MDEGAGSTKETEGPIKQLRAIVEDAGLEGSVEVEKVKAATAASQHFDAENNEYVDMMHAGVIDPIKVERIALQQRGDVQGHRPAERLRRSVERLRQFAASQESRGRGGKQRRWNEVSHE